MFTRLALAAALVLTMPLATPRAAAAQSAAEHVAMGDREHTAMNAAGALARYEAALAADPAHYPALWRASREAVELGEFSRDEAQRRALFAKAERYARQAVAANPNDAEGHFALARALGRAALSVGRRERIRYATDVRTSALNALRLRPEHAGALHVMGVWNAEIMRLGGVERFVAKNLLGGRVFDEASWREAASFLERAVAAEPERTVHRLALARVHADMGNRARAREQLEWIARAAPRDYNDAHYRLEADQLLRSLR